MTPEQSFRPRPDVLLTEMQDGTGILLDLNSKFYFTLNRSALLVWKALASGGKMEGGDRGEGDTTRRSLIETVSAVYRVEHDRAAADVDELLDELIAERLVEPISGGA